MTTHKSIEQWGQYIDELEEKNEQLSQELARMRLQYKQGMETLKRQLMAKCPKKDKPGTVEPPFEYEPMVEITKKELAVTINYVRELAKRTNNGMYANTIMAWADILQKHLNKKRDPIVEAVRKKFHGRSQFGLDKYGIGLDRDDLNTQQWLTHLQEELMDATNYVEVLLQREDE